MTTDRDTKFMCAALDAAREALEAGNFPIGAALVIDGELVATGANAVDSHMDDTRHAEMVVLGENAPEVFAAKRTRSVELFVTMEPCAMCVGAIAHFRVGRVVSALDDGYAGAVDQFHQHPYYGNRGTQWVRGFMGAEASALLQEYQSLVGRRKHLTAVAGPNGLRLEFAPHRTER